MEQDAKRYQAVGNFLAQENRGNAKGKDVQVRKRSRENQMVYVCNADNRSQDQRYRKPRRSDGSDILPQWSQQWDPIA